ncbi:MAG: hypothetical protein CL878_01790 [Dehalococcoidia bacterium]|nr:hypothetical protein [Dehalococcoidia bacterium]
MSGGVIESADYSSAARLTVRPATPDDLPEIVRVYIAAYAQPPWHEQNDPTHSRMYLEWLLGIPDSQCLVVANGESDANGEDRVRGMVMSAPRTAAEFYEDWVRICHPLPRGWPRLPTASNAIGYIYELAVDPPWQGHRLGRQLLDTALDGLTRLGAELLALRTSERAPIAVGLYERRSFTRWPLRETQQHDARWWHRRARM